MLESSYGVCTRRFNCVDALEPRDDKSLRTKFHRECYAGKDVHRFSVSFQNRYCYFNRIAKRGGCWDEKVHGAKNKILVRQVGEYPESGLDTLGYAVLNAAFMILPYEDNCDSRFLLGVLNSAVIRFYWMNRFRDDRKTFPKIKGEYLKMLPIPKFGSQEQCQIAQLVQAVVVAKQKDLTTALEEAIDKAVYALYGLTPREIQVIEGSLQARTKVANI